MGEAIFNSGYKNMVILEVVLIFYKAVFSQHLLFAIWNEKTCQTK